MATPIGIIGGTALAALAGLEAAEHAEPLDTPYGPPSGPLVRGRLHSVDVCFIMRHGSGHRIAPHRINYRANIRALADAGCKRVIGIAAVGGITADTSMGRLVVPDQIVDYTWGRAHTFYDDNDSGALDHIDFTAPYSGQTRQTLLETARGLDLDPMAQAVHGVTQGPRLETAAEINRLERDGCDIVGMTGMPEAALARETGLDYACLAVVVNPGAGRSARAIHADIQATLERGMATIERLLEAALPRLAM